MLFRWFKDDMHRTPSLLALSAGALALSFFKVLPLPFDIAWLAILLCGIPIIKGAIVGLVTEFDIKADVLVSLALIASILIGEIFAAGEVAFIMAIGAFLEERTVAKARAGIERLVHLTPTTARVIREGSEEIVPANQVRIGDTLRVLAGETIAVDGIITMGQTSIDQSVMTGESLPVDKTVGDGVYSGTVNQYGPFDMEATKVGEDSSLQRMIRLVESADAGKAKIVGMADRWATWIVVFALLAAAVTWGVTGEVIRAVTILVVFCPCALVLATPTAIMAGIGNASKSGILVRAGDALERLAGVRHIAFDKTGTLTHGKPALIAVHSLAPDLDDDMLLALAATAELRSEHPLGKAIVAAHLHRSGTPAAEPDSFTLLAGMGVFARIGSEEILAGNEALLKAQRVEMPACAGTMADQAQLDGSTRIFLARDGVAIGLLVLSDTLRPDATPVVSAIHQTGLQTLLLTGDASPAARHMAGRVGIDQVHSACLPARKMGIIQSLQEKKEYVCMIGDGINDAPSLKAAHVGIAMGGVGSDIAIEAADMVLVGDDIRQVPHLVRLARKTMQTIRYNLIASMALNFAAIAFAILGVLNPITGALVHNVGSVVVIVNSALLLSWGRRDASKETNRMVA